MTQEVPSYSVLSERAAACGTVCTLCGADGATEVVLSERRCPNCSRHRNQIIKQKECDEWRRAELRKTGALPVCPHMTAELDAEQRPRGTTKLTQD